MFVDLLTLYFLAIGTLLASAGMTFWEHRTNPRRSKTLRILAAGFATLGLGCAAILFRRDVPSPYGSAFSNLIVLSGYLLILNGVASISGRLYLRTSAVVLGAMALAWAILGARWEDGVWNYVCSVPISIASGLTAWEMLRCHAMKPFQARRLIVFLSALHAVVYAARATLLPWLVTAYGVNIQAVASNITLYEGVLYSVVLPMALLKMIREETHGQLLQESRTDYLTRLGNRRWFFEEGVRVIDGGGRKGPVAILAFDLDQFKAINDLYGHETGDKVLRSFAEIAQEALGSSAMVARIGGEEFAALLVGDDARRARELGEAVAIRFADRAADQSGGLGLPATVSIGMAQFEDDVPGLADGLAAADQALYRAKAMGGNRLEMAEGAGR